MHIEFPNSYYLSYPLPYEDDSIPDSFYVFDKAYWNNNDPGEVDILDNYKQFFLDHERIMQELIRNSTNPFFAEWLRAQLKKKVVLERHFFSTPELYQREDTQHAIQFTSSTNLTDWKSFKTIFRVTVELLDKQDFAHLPEPLKEIYAFGRIDFYGYRTSGHFLHPKEVILAREGEFEKIDPYLVEYLAGYKKNDYKKEMKTLGGVLQLMPFYDESGCYLLYDPKEIVWAAGAECGDVYCTNLSLTEVLGRLFNEALTDQILDFDKIAPGLY